MPQAHCIAVLLIAGSLFSNKAASQPLNPFFSGFQDGGKCGVMSADKKILIPAIYDSIHCIHQLVLIPNKGYVIQKEYFVTHQNGLAGLYGEQGEILRTQFRSITEFEENSRNIRPMRFAVVDSLGKHSVINQLGEALVPYDELSYQPVYTLRAWQKGTGVEYVSQVNAQRCQRIRHLSSGEQSDWYDEIYSIGDWFLASYGMWWEQARWIVLDTNFQVILKPKSEKESLRYFGWEYEPEEAHSFPNQGEYEELYLYNNVLNGRERYVVNVPEVFAIREFLTEERVLENKLYSQEVFGLLNITTGKRTALKYYQIQKFADLQEVFYWAYPNDSMYREHNELGAPVDIFDAKGNYVRSIHLNREERIDTKDIHDEVRTRAAEPHLFILTDYRRWPYESSPMHCSIRFVDGTQPANYEFTELPRYVVRNGATDGFIVLQDSTKLLHLEDFSGDDLFDQKRFNEFYPVYDPSFKTNLFWLKQGDTAIIVDSKLNVLISGCTRVSWKQLENHTYQSIQDGSILVNKGKEVYIYEDGKFVLVKGAWEK